MFDRSPGLPSSPAAAGGSGAGGIASRISDAATSAVDHGGANDPGGAGAERSTVLEGLDGLDAAATCAAVVENHRAVLAAEARLLWLAAHWADLHSAESLEGKPGVSNGGKRALPGMERARQVGADGTPAVAEFAAAELAALQQVSRVSGWMLMRDALDLRHRHPLLWDLVMSGQVRAWQAREIARKTSSAALDLGQALWLDARVSRYVGCLPWSRLLALVEATIVEADPGAAEERRRAAAMERFVRTGQSGEYGLKTLVARAAAGDVVFFVAMCDRIAQVLALRGDPDPLDVRRSKAVGILATPERALRLLEEALDLDAVAGTGAHTPPGPAPSASAAASAAARANAGPDPGEADDPPLVGERDVHPRWNDADEAPRHRWPCPACWGTGSTEEPPDQVAARLGRRAVDPGQLLPKAVLYVHMSRASLTDPDTGVARVEGAGPVTVAQLRDLLGQTQVTVKPVIDVAGLSPVDGYESPDRLREAMHLLCPVEVAPWGTHAGRGKDQHHVRPYRARASGGPPGQTQPGNLAPLGRTWHRIVTHGRWQVTQPGLGVYLWRSPHGYWFRVDHTGTTSYGKHPPPEAFAAVNLSQGHLAESIATCLDGRGRPLPSEP